MAEIVNLRLARKRRKRAEAEATAAQNRIDHGTAKSLRDLESSRRALDRRRLDAHHVRDREEDAE